MGVHGFNCMMSIPVQFFPLLLQETDILSDNLAKHILNDSEVLFETRDLRTLANLQESMVRVSPLLHYS